jgi:AcrR family transcriptional regulator
MHSENSETIQNPPKRSFIEEARRTQIIAAAIETLAEVGYGKASLAQIAKRAQISPSLIPYHFADKEELIEQTLEAIASAWDNHVQNHVATATTARDQLRRYIEASLSYMGTRPQHFATMVEIAFNARTVDGTLLYRTDAEETGFTLLRNLLMQGQERGEFRSFNAHHMALAIRGAINEFFGAMHKADVSLEVYTADVVALFLRVTAAE